MRRRHSAVSLGSWRGRTFFAPTLALSAEVLPHVRTAYETRTAAELPVLTRYLPRTAIPPGLAPPVARVLDVILYDRAQLDKENAAMREKKAAARAAAAEASGQEVAEDVAPEPVGGSDTPWGIVSVKPQDCEDELPMNPATMLRNALGKAEGGSGVPLDRDAYMAAVAFWRDHVTIK